MFEIGGYYVRIVNINALQDHIMKHLADDLEFSVLLLKIILLHFEEKIVQMSGNIEKKKNDHHILHHQASL